MPENLNGLLFGLRIVLEMFQPVRDASFGSANPLGAVAPRAMPARSSASPARGQIASPGWPRPNVRYGAGGLESRNFVTLTQKGANSPQMQGFEQAVARKLHAGEVVDYSVTPLYDDGVLPPSLIVMTAHGSRSGPSARLVRNPIGRRK